MTAPVSALDVLAQIVGHSAAEQLIVDLAVAGYRIEPDARDYPDHPDRADQALTDMITWLLERRAEYRRQASNAPRDSVEQQASRETADALGEVAFAITERWVKP